MPAHSGRSTATFILVALSAFLCDRVSKIVAMSLLAGGDYAIFPGFSFGLVINTGISFSMFANSASWVLTGIIALVVALLIIIWRFTTAHCLSNWGYGLIIGGAVGNFVDRLYVGGVIDFIDIYYGRWHWPTFNLADTAICVGFLLLVWENWHAKAS